MLDSLEKTHLPEGERIFMQGDKADAAYFLVSGKIGIYKNVDGKKVHLGTVRNGSIFGEMAAIDGGLRMASAITLAPSTIVKIPAEVMAQKIAKADPFLKALITIMIDNLRNVHKAYVVRPRSLHDHVASMKEHAANLRHYVINAEGLDDFAALSGKIDQLEAVIEELGSLTVNQPDRREDNVPDLKSLP